MLSSFSKKLLFTLAMAALVTANTFAADLEHGLDIAKRICGACHGSKGISRAPVIPNLSTQKEEYILKQLRSFKDGSRSNSSMEGVVVNLDDKDLVDVAAHFAANGAVEDTTSKVSGKIKEKAKEKLSICLPCHGSYGASTAPQFPNLAGQKDRYLMKQLEKFQDGRRKDPTMNGIATQLSKGDIKVLAKYFSKAGVIKGSK